MIKAMITLMTILSSSPLLLASEPFQEAYVCSSTRGEDIGPISLYGDPVEDIYSEIRVDDNLMAFRYGVTTRTYIYLYDDRVYGTKSYALEVFNYPAQYNEFKIYLYGKNQVVIGSTKIATYTCVKDL